MIASLEKSTVSQNRILHAVIGVWFRGDRTFYVQRSDNMQNYPGAWSLFSIQFDPAELHEPFHLPGAQKLMERMSAQRLHGTPVETKRFLTATTCTKNPINKIVKMWLYQIEFMREPDLNSEYYINSAWMTQEEYHKRRSTALCGSCIRMWADYYCRQVACV